MVLDNNKPKSDLLNAICCWSGIILINFYIERAHAKKNFFFFVAKQLSWETKLPGNFKRREDIRVPRYRLSWEVRGKIHMSKDMSRLLIKIENKYISNFLLNCSFMSRDVWSNKIHSFQEIFINNGNFDS